MPRVAPLLIVATLVLATGCARSWSRMDGRRTCVVLSAGGPAGLAHLGALRAVREDSLRVDCVTGTSMGALVGSLYAAEPKAPIEERYRALLQRYESATLRDKAGHAVVGGLLGGVLAGLLTDGKPWPIVAGVTAGAAAGANATGTLELARFVEVLDEFHGGRAIEATAVPYATFFQVRKDHGLDLLTARSGNLAAAVGKSIANPFIFASFDPVKSGYVDPGADRMAATPIDDTCRLFPGARLLAVNVTGRPAVYGKGMNCPLLEVRIDVDPVKDEAMRGDGPEFSRVVLAGYEGTRKALSRARSH